MLSYIIASVVLFKIIFRIVNGRDREDAEEDQEREYII